MQIAVKATDSQWNELTGESNSIVWIRVAEQADFFLHPEIDAAFDLDGNSLHPNLAGVGIPIFINAVTTTLTALHAPENVLRLNGWTGFLKRPAWELAGRVDEKVYTVFAKLNKEIIPVADEPGLVAARIISMIINEAYFAIGDEVSSPGEIDTAMKLGTNYPFGPFEWAGIIGIDNILELLRKLAVNDTRYEPAPLMVKALSDNTP